MILAEIVLTQNDLILWAGIVVGSIASFKGVMILVDKSVENSRKVTDADIENKIAQLRLSLSTNISDMIGLNNTHITENIREIKAGSEKTNLRLSEIEKSMAVMDTEAEHMGEKIDKMEATLTRMDEKFEIQGQLLNKIYNEFLIFSGKKGDKDD